MGGRTLRETLTAPFQRSLPLAHPRRGFEVSGSCQLFRPPPLSHLASVVLEALPQVHTSLGLRLVVIGEGHLRPRLERLARERPSMLCVLPFEADRSRLPRAYAAADLFFAPCPYETFGLAALEAMASGLPVVGVAAGGVGPPLVVAVL